MHTVVSPIFTRTTIPGSEDCECTLSYDCSALYDPEVTSVRNVDLPVVAFKFLMSYTVFLQLIVRKSFAQYW